MSSAGKPFRIKRQTQDGETIHAPTYNACRCCYQPLLDKKTIYCDSACEQAHTRLRGAA